MQNGVQVVMWLGGSWMVMLEVVVLVYDRWQLETGRWWVGGGRGIQRV